MNPLYEFITKPFNPNNSNDNNVLMDNMLRTMEFEGGHREKVYLDSEGYPTIGVGHLLERTKYEVPEGEDPKSWVPEKFRDITWTEQQGMDTFLEDYLNMQQDVSRRYGEEQFEALPKDAQGILTDLAFNLGAEGLFGGKETKGFPGFLKDFREGKYGEAAKELQYKNPDKGNFEESLWWGQVGGSKNEERNQVRADNRATATFDLLMSLMNAQNQ